MGWLGSHEPGFPAFCVRARRGWLCALGADLKTMEHQPLGSGRDAGAGHLVFSVALPTAAEAADICGAEAGCADLRLEIGANGADA